MILRTLQGVPFEIVSPSFYRLAKTLTGADTIDISFLGDEWCLFHERASGGIGTRMFPDRDSAVKLIADAFAGVPAP